MDGVKGRGEDRDRTTHSRTPSAPCRPLLSFPSKGLFPYEPYRHQDTDFYRPFSTLLLFSRTSSGVSILQRSVHFPRTPLIFISHGHSHQKSPHNRFPTTTTPSYPPRVSGLRYDVTTETRLQSPSVTFKFGLSLYQSRLKTFLVT